MKIIKEVITSRNNPVVKWASTLQNKKGRDDARAFIAEGEKLSYEAIMAKLPITHIFISEEKRDKILNKIQPMLFDECYSSTEVIILSEGAFQKISTEKAPQGVITVIKYLDFFEEIDIIYKEEFSLNENERAIILSSVRDPGNIGAAIRSAVAFGVDRIIVTNDSADLYNPKTVRSAMGSLFRVKITVAKDIISLIRAIKDSGRRVLAAELSDKALSLSEIGLLSSDVVIIGNEGHGIDPEISSAASASVYIPISKKTESLNASVAAAIFMWEASK